MLACFSVNNMICFLKLTQANIFSFQKGNSNQPMIPTKIFIWVPHKNDQIGHLAYLLHSKSSEKKCFSFVQLLFQAIHCRRTFEEDGPV